MIIQGLKNPHAGGLIRKVRVVAIEARTPKNLHAGGLIRKVRVVALEARIPKIHVVIRRNLKVAVLNDQDTRCTKITVCAL